MALNFPNAPIEGESYEAEGVSYLWKTNRWAIVGAASPTGENLITVQSRGDESLFFIDDSVPNSTPMTVGVDLFETSVDYAGNPITAGDLRNGTVTLNKPVISGTTGIGDTFTVAPAIQIYPGDDPDPHVFQWRRNGFDIDGALGTTYTLVALDAGTTITVTQTYGGVTVESDGVIIPADTMYPKATILNSGSTIDAPLSNLNTNVAFTPQLGTNRMLYLIIQPATSIGPLSDPTVVEFNGTPFTEHFSRNMNASNRCQTWGGYMLDTDISSTGQIVITFGNANVSGATRSFAITVIELEGVNQTTPFGTFVETTSDFGGTAGLPLDLVLADLDANNQVLALTNYFFGGDIVLTSDAGGTFTELMQATAQEVSHDQLGIAPPNPTTYTITSGGSNGPNCFVFELNGA